MWATVYPLVASATYGPSTLVYDVDRETRSADIQYLARLFERGFHLSQRSGSTLYDIGWMARGGLVGVWGGGNTPNSDVGQIVIPAYVPPSDVAGFELRDKGAKGAVGAARIELAFYKWTPKAHEPPFVLFIDAPGTAGGTPECITPQGSTTSTQPPQLFACQPFNFNSNRIPSLVSADTSRPILIAAVVFTIDPSASHAAHITACETARSAVSQSRMMHWPGGNSLRQWPRIAAAINSTRVNCKGHALVVTRRDASCDSVLQDWATRVNSQGGRVTHVDDRFGWQPSGGSKDWHGTVPREWTTLAPAPACASTPSSPSPSQPSLPPPASQPHAPSPAIPPPNPPPSPSLLPPGPPPLPLPLAPPSTFSIDSSASPPPLLASPGPPRPHLPPGSLPLHPPPSGSPTPRPPVELTAPETTVAAETTAVAFFLAMGFAAALVSSFGVFCLLLSIFRACCYRRQATEGAPAKQLEGAKLAASAAKRKPTRNQKKNGVRVVHQPLPSDDLEAAEEEQPRIERLGGKVEDLEQDDSPDQEKAVNNEVATRKSKGRSAARKPRGRGPKYESLSLDN